MVEIGSADVEAMRDEVFGELLNEINAKQQQLSMAISLGVGMALMGLAALFLVGTAGVIFLYLRCQLG